MVDSLGGVNICVPFHMNDKKAGINLKKGCQVLDGTNALGYVRARYSDPRGDIGRAERQRQFLARHHEEGRDTVDVLIPRATGASHTPRPRGSSSVRTPPCVDASRVLLAMRAVSTTRA